MNQPTNFSANKWKPEKNLKTHQVWPLYKIWFNPENQKTIQFGFF